jgi:hypothetical protein
MPKYRETNDMNNTKNKMKKKKTDLRTNQKMLTGWSKSKDGDRICLVFPCDLFNRLCVFAFFLNRYIYAQQIQKNSTDMNIDI